MKTVVITGSTRGLGFEMAKCFRRYGWNVLLNGADKRKIENAMNALKSIKGKGAVSGFRADVSSAKEINALAEYAGKKYRAVDIWINNAGINQPLKALWELSDTEICSLVDIDLKGAVIGSKAAVRLMLAQPNGGYIYNVEGYGSNNAKMLGFNMYGTSKRAVTHFTIALAEELEERKCKVKAGRLSPGIMITDFITNAMNGEQKIVLPEKTKSFYNVTADYPDVVAEFLVKSMIRNKKNNVHFQWLTNRKVAARFISSGFRKRDFFSE